MYNLNKILDQFWQYVREGENCSCIYLAWREGAFQPAMFTYIADETEEGIVFYGFCNELVYNNGLVYCEDKSGIEVDEIIVHNIERVSVKERDSLYNEYYAIVQEFLDGKTTIDQVGIKFRTIIPDDVAKIYKLICTDFIDEFYN